MAELRFKLRRPGSSADALNPVAPPSSVLRASLRLFPVTTRLLEVHSASAAFVSPPSTSSLTPCNRPCLYYFRKSAPMGKTSHSRPSEFLLPPLLPFGLSSQPDVDLPETPFLWPLHQVIFRGRPQGCRHALLPLLLSHTSTPRRILPRVPVLPHSHSSLTSHVSAQQKQ